MTRQLVLFAGLLVSISAPADEIQVEKASEFRPILKGGEVDSKIEPSGVEPIGDGKFLLVADDKTPGLVVVETATGKRVGEPISSPQFPKSPKWEAMALDDDGTYYVSGSHSGTKPDQIEGRSSLFRFRLAAGPVPKIDESSVARFDITSGLRPLGYTTTADNKVKIEGLAIRPLADGTKQLVVGLRLPVDPKDGILVLAAPIPSALAINGALTPLDLHPLFSFAAGDREKVQNQVGSLEYAPNWKGFLVVTTSEDEKNLFHGNILWFLPDGSSTPRKVWTFGVNRKCEGLCVLPPEAGSKAGSSSLRLALTFDNDAADTKNPSEYQVVTLVRWAD